MHLHYSLTMQCITQHILMHIINAPHASWCIHMLTMHYANHTVFKAACALWHWCTHLLNTLCVLIACITQVLRFDIIILWAALRKSNGPKRLPSADLSMYILTLYYTYNISIQYIVHSTCILIIYVICIPVVLVVLRWVGWGVSKSRSMGSWGKQ